MELTLQYGPSERRAVARSAGAGFTMDAPASCDGPGENPCPVDVFGASLATCMVMAMDMAAERDGFSILGAKIDVNVESSGCGTPALGRIEVTVHLPEPLEEDKLAVLRDGAENCPIHNSLKPGVDVDIRLENP